MGNNFSHITNSCKVDNEGSSIHSTIYSDEELLFSEVIYLGVLLLGSNLKYLVVYVYWDVIM